MMAKGLKIRLTRTGDAFSIAKQQKQQQQQGKEDGTEETTTTPTTTPTTTGGNEEDEDMVNHVAYSSSPVKTIMPIESSAKIRKDREDENNNNSTIVETPSKKSRRSGKNGVPDNANATATAATPVVAAGQQNLVQDSGEPNPLDVTKSIRMESHQDTTGIHETTNTEGGDNGMDAAAEPSKETAMPLKTPESAARPEPPEGDVYRIPSYAGWFEWAKVHPLERKAMSEFFDKRSVAKTPRIYKEYRDFIINKYRENPKRALTFNEVRCMMIGDVNSLGRVFDFLEHWGLINHQVSSDQAASEAPPPSPTVVDSYPSGINVVTLPIISKPNILPVNTGNSMSAMYMNNFATHKNIFTSPTKSPGVNTPAGSKKPDDEIQCNQCKRDCSKQRFCQKQQPSISLCPDCFKNGKFPAGTSAGEFIQVANSDPKPTVKEWTNKETLLLLEAVKRFGDNWNQVAVHVPTRSKSDCVKHFIQLPFGDAYQIEPDQLEPSPGATGSVQDVDSGVTPVSDAEAAASSDHLVENRAIGSADAHGATQGTEATVAAHDLVSPFTDTSHPLFAQVALLSGMVGPRVAAAAAQAAVAAIAEDEPEVSELPFMQSPKLTSKHKRHASQTFQNHTDSFMEASQELQADQEEAHGDKSGSQNATPLPNNHSAKENAAVDELPSAVQARASVATALGVAAASAKLLADQEEREIEHLVANIIDNQMKKLCAKLEHFEELEMLLEKERLELERARQQVYADRIRYAEGQTATRASILRHPAPS